MMDRAVLSVVYLHDDLTVHNNLELLTAAGTLVHSLTTPQGMKDENFIRVFIFVKQIDFGNVNHILTL